MYSCAFKKWWSGRKADVGDGSERALAKDAWNAAIDILLHSVRKCPYIDCSHCAEDCVMGERLG